MHLHRIPHVLTNLVLRAIFSEMLRGSLNGNSTLQRNTLELFLLIINKRYLGQGTNDFITPNQSSAIRCILFRIYKARRSRSQPDARKVIVFIIIIYLLIYMAGNIISLQIESVGLHSVQDTVHGSNLYLSY